MVCDSTDAGSAVHALPGSMDVFWVALPVCRTATAEGCDGSSDPACAVTLTSLLGDLVGVPIRHSGSLEDVLGLA